MPTILLSRTIAGAPDSAPSVKLKDATNTYGIRRDSDSAVIVAPTSALTPTSEGDYSYDLSAIPTGASYTAVWEVINESGTPRYFPQSFTLAEDIAFSEGPTLMEVEQEVARILGPFDDMEVGSSTSNTVLSAYIPELTSTIGYGGIEDRYMLRRGFKSDGSRIAGFLASDRVRQVASIDEGFGLVTPDRPWTNSPVVTEIIEFHHLHPERELRKAVLSGLGRCYLWDRVSVLTLSIVEETNLTALIPYLKNPDLIQRVEAKSVLDSIFGPVSVREWRPFFSNGSVFLRTSQSPYPQDMLITLLRPSNTLVNGAISLHGPDNDEDVLSVSLEYARAAGHIEAWRYFRRKLQPVAQTGLFNSRAEAAAEFTTQSEVMRHSQSEPEFPRLEWSYGHYGSTS